MDITKRYIALKGDRGSSVFLTVERSANKTTVTPFSKTADGGYFILSDGQKFQKSADNDVIALDFDFDKEFYCCFVSDGERYFARIGNAFSDAEGLINEYEKILVAQTDATPTQIQDTAPYDDEKIAEENYYLKERKNGKTESVQNAFSQRSRKIEQEGAFGVPNARKDDAYRRFGEKSDETGDGTDLAQEQSRETLHERGGRERQAGNIEKMLATFPREEALSKIYPFGAFARVNDGRGRIFIVGKIERCGEIFYCVGNEGRKNMFSAAADDRKFFVPRSPFSDDDGYILSFFKKGDGEYLRRKF